jgi:hypothetical protein
VTWQHRTRDPACCLHATRMSGVEGAPAERPPGCPEPHAGGGRGRSRASRGGRSAGRSDAAPRPRSTVPAPLAVTGAPASASQCAPPGATLVDSKPGGISGRGRRGAQRGRGRGAPVAASSSAHEDGWWKSLGDEEVDPITLEPLSTLSYAPFTLPLSDTKDARFDGGALAQYLVTCRNFVNPLSRAAISREQCQELDAYLKRHRLGPPRVTMEFDEAKAALEAAAQANTAEALLAQRLATAEALLRSFYTHTRTSRDARRQDTHAAASASPAFQSEGGLTVMDDDAGMRGFSRTDAVAVLESRPRGAVLTAHVPPPRVEHFPALPPPAAAQAVRPAPARTQGTTDDAQRTRPSWWALAAPSAPKVATAQPPASGPSAAGRAGQSGDDAREQRRKQLAAAFGVSNPESRPSTFAASSAEAFTPETLALARAEPEFVAEVERRFEEALRLNTNRRVSLPPMPRSKRRLVHEVGAQWHVATHAYGEGAGRHIDLFLIPGLSGFPNRHLSDAAKLSPEAAAAAAGAAAATGGGQEGGSLVLYFADVAAGVEISNVVAPWADDVADVSCDPERGTATATFTSEAAFSDARARLGAGVRAKFTVKAAAASGKSSARAAPAAAHRAREADPWAETGEATRHVARVRGEPPASWEVLGDQAVSSGRVAPPAAAPVVSRNRWSALGGDESDNASDSGGDSAPPPSIGCMGAGQ